MNKSEILKNRLGLSDGEAKLLYYVIEENTNDQIATLLQVKTGTVKSRLWRLYQNLGVKNRVGAVLKGARVLWDTEEFERWQKRSEEPKSIESGAI